MMYKIFSIVIFFLASYTLVTAQQIAIPRIEQMPNKPSPYLMRNWKGVSLGYDSLVFNFNVSGQYLPLIFEYSNTINYPDHPSFGLNTVVGTTRPASGEAINVLPAIISATLNGVDKSNQNGRNFVLMAEEYFNKVNGENVYLNSPSASTGDDWWYETMPNVFFYQLNYFYPHTGDFDHQFYTVADRWLQSVISMGGSSTPWKVPYMNYRAYKLKSMTPLTSGVTEPEAAGAIAWILYNAYNQSGNEKYRIGAEWSLEFLNNWQSNPSYELQLPYGVYTAARMNAELGTNFNIEKFVNWCFDVGPLRGWGSIIGNWGGYDVSGLIGENSSNDYAFIMNTFELAGALVPMVRYDDRFARSIGKWALNASNAARLLYPNYLPDDHQDSEEWSHIYDPNSYISHEAMRKSINGISPFATGDAITGGWGNTNLALYGSSHVGIFGALIDTTNIEGILKLDLLKTDYYHDTAFASYLIYNPYTENKNVFLNTGSGLINIYDAVSNTFLASNVSGTASVTIPANSAIIAVLTPANGIITTNLNKRFCNGVIIDYNSGEIVSNYPPRIKSLSISKNSVITNENIKVYCTSEDRDNNSLTFSWTAARGAITGTADSIIYTAPSKPGKDSIKCIVNDSKGGTDSAKIVIDVFAYINEAPVINKIKVSPRKMDINSTAKVNCFATDSNGDSLFYSWSVSSGTITKENGSSAVYNSPSAPGNYYIFCSVSDTHNAVIKDSILVEVRDISSMPTGQLILYYPFNGNAADSSGNNLNGFVYQAQLVPDRFGNPNSAYLFNGLNNYIQTSNSPLLNFSNSITINFWMTIKQFYDREAYPISHGNWQNRWKVSITNNKIRWTVKSGTGIKDLDSETDVVKDSLYMVTCFYNGSDFELYINGELDAFTSFSGAILNSPVDMIIGQALPGDYNYGFNGILDDIRIYNYGLRPSVIKNFFDLPVYVNDQNPIFPSSELLSQNFPNPFNPSTLIRFLIPRPGFVKLSIFNSLGEKIKDLISKYMNAGSYEVNWDANGISSGVYFYTLSTGQNNITKKMIYLR